MKVPKLNSNFKDFMDLLYGNYILDFLKAAIELNVFDAFSEKKLTSQEISELLEIESSVMEKFLDVLVAFNFFSKDAKGYYLTDLSKDFLLKKSLAYQGGIIEQLEQVKTKLENISSLIRKKNNFEFFGNSWANKKRMELMGQYSLGGQVQNIINFISKSSDFQNIKTICDLGGNHGYYLMGLLDVIKNSKGILCDLPDVIKISKELIIEKGYSDRIRTLEIDFEKTQNFGEKFDLIFTSNFLYGQAGNNQLTEFFKSINFSLNSGGIFLSNHYSDKMKSGVSNSITELITKIMGYPTHHISEKQLISSMKKTGFSEFRYEFTENGYLIFSGKKIKNI